MKKIEIALAIALGASVIGKLMHFSGSGLLLYLVALILSCFYFLLGFAVFNGIGFRGIFKKSSYAGTTGLKIIVSIALGLLLSQITLGILFRLQIWEGGGLLLLTGLIPLAPIFIGALVGLFIRKTPFFRIVVIRVALLGGFGLIAILVSRSQLADIYYRDDPDYAEVYRKHLDDPTDETLRLEWETARRKKYKLEQQAE